MLDATRIAKIYCIIDQININSQFIAIARSPYVF